MERDYGLKRAALRVVASMGTLAMLYGCVAETKQDVADCNARAPQQSVTLEILDGESKKISSYPNRLDLVSRRDSGVTVNSTLGDTPLPPITIGNKARLKSTEIEIVVPGDTVYIKGYNKVHEITDKGRGANNSSSVVEVKAYCNTQKASDK